MKFTKRLTALLLSAAAAVSCFSMTVCAEDVVLDETATEESEESNYITSGDYKYSLGDYFGETGAYLEEYLGSETEVVIPDEIDGYPVVGLGDGTFYFKEDITEITIPASLGDFGYFPFYGCTSLMEFKVDEANEIYEADEDGAIVGKDGLTIMAYPTGKNPESYEVKDGIVAVNSSAFAMCTNLKEVTLPDTVEFLGNYVFAECTSLESIVIPEKVTALGNYIFSGCTALKDITLPEGLTRIGNAAFFECTSLETIDFPSSLTEIGQAAFCSVGMTSVTLPATITNYGYSAFGFKTDDNDQIVPQENFIVMGYTNSAAQTYCTEHEVTFQALDEELYTEPVTQSTAAVNEEKKIPVKKIAIISAAVLGVIVIIAGIFGFKKKSKVNKPEKDEEEDVDMPTLDELCEEAEKDSKTEEEK